MNLPRARGRIRPHVPTGPTQMETKTPPKPSPQMWQRLRYRTQLASLGLYWALEALVKVSVTEFNTREYVTKPPTLSALQNHPEKLKATVTTSQTETAAFHRFPRLNKTQVSNAIESVS